MVRVVSDNPSYATYELHPSDIEIQGRVIWTARNVWQIRLAAWAKAAFFCLTGRVNPI